MPIGTNQLNILMFEVGYVKRPMIGGKAGPPITVTTGIHPLLVAPKVIRYTDASRSPILQTMGGSLVTQSGRALRQLSLEGTFGVDARGLLAYLGTGEVRFQRFYREVVRMGDAIFNDEVELNLDVGLTTSFLGPIGAVGSPADFADLIIGSPGLQAALSQYDEKDSTFYVNFFDFWNKLSFQAQISTFRWHREHRNGGASGLVHYTMDIKEIGPVITGSTANQLIGALLQGLTLWGAVNDAIESYTPGAILGITTSVSDIVLAQVNDTKEAVVGDLGPATALMGGQTDGDGISDGGSVATGSISVSTGTGASAKSTTGTAETGAASNLATASAQSGISKFFARADNLLSASRDLADGLSSQLDSFQNDVGVIDFSSQVDEGGSTSLDVYDEIVKARDLEELALFQKVSGVFFGMSRHEYQAYITAGGSFTQQAPEIGGSIQHTVTTGDTPTRLERQYNVDFSRILAVNRLTPDEALYPGTVLEIPIVRTRGPQGLEGLPTFGSHVGQQAWGTDLQAGMTADSEGKPVVLSGSDCLVQGANYLLALFGDDLIDQVDRVPEQVRVSYLQDQLKGIFSSDHRISSVGEISIESEGTSASLDIQVTLHAINGGTIRTGA